MEKKASGFAAENYFQVVIWSFWWSTFSLYIYLRIHQTTPANLIDFLAYHSMGERFYRDVDLLYFQPQSNCKILEVICAFFIAFSSIVACFQFFFYFSGGKDGETLGISWLVPIFHVLFEKTAKIPRVFLNSERICGTLAIWKS